MGIDYSSQIGKKLTTKGYQKICVHIESIMYIQCHGHLATIFLNDERKVDEVKSLKSFEEDLYEMGFIRISRNTIVNGKYITGTNTIRGKRIVCLEDIVLNVSKRRLGFLNKQLFKLGNKTSYLS
ncbi:MAG: LytTR family transcriptional regulator DNA-binding domain-containing protein [Bacteroidetes bacterium]|nr:LytTR family transcriptional regulator DNA-binding domain-containing protein [Bacteroidota bacterium]MCL2302969.1 LytTR family transcriptional regulator DNA-binding domain-containing protein [Lentimicrobiaceae bacterium]